MEGKYSKYFGYSQCAAAIHAATEGESSGACRGAAGVYAVDVGWRNETEGPDSTKSC